MTTTNTPVKISIPRRKSSVQSLKIYPRRVSALNSPYGSISSSSPNTYSVLFESFSPAFNIETEDTAEIKPNHNRFGLFHPFLHLQLSYQGSTIDLFISCMSSFVNLQGAILKCIHQRDTTSLGLTYKEHSMVITIADNEDWNICKEIHVNRNKIVLFLV